MGRNFALTGRTRRIARAVVETMSPRWPGFDVDLTDRVLQGVEHNVRHWPTAFQAAFVAGLWGLEVATPALGGARSTFSTADAATRERLLDRLHDSKLGALRRTVQLYSVFVTLNAYTQPEVEAFLGVKRRHWRDARRQFREQLVQLEPRERPATPAPLGDEALSASYLRDDAVPHVG